MGYVYRAMINYFVRVPAVYRAASLWSFLTRLLQQGADNNDVIQTLQSASLSRRSKTARYGPNGSTKCGAQSLRLDVKDGGVGSAQHVKHFADAILDFS